MRNFPLMIAPIQSRSALTEVSGLPHQGYTVHLDDIRPDTVRAAGVFPHVLFDVSGRNGNAEPSGTAFPNMPCHRRVSTRFGPQREDSPIGKRPA
jgi:hypothetical protein